jgi:hypothetical protein
MDDDLKDDHSLVDELYLLCFSHLSLGLGCLLKSISLQYVCQVSVLHMHYTVAVWQSILRVKY